MTEPHWQRKLQCSDRVLNMIVRQVLSYWLKSFRLNYRKYMLQKFYKFISNRKWKQIYENMRHHFHWTPRICSLAFKKEIEKYSVFRALKFDNWAIKCSALKIPQICSISTYFQENSLGAPITLHIV